jgi:hypothetical protein
VIEPEVRFPCDAEFSKRTTGTEAMEDGLVHLAESPRPSWER